MIKNIYRIGIWTMIGICSGISGAQEPTAVQTEDSFEAAAKSITRQLADSVAELNALREQAATEKVPLNRKLRNLESELTEVRLEYQDVSRLLDSRTLDLSNLRTEIKTRKDEASYLSNLLSEYIRNFESRLHIVELQRYDNELEQATLAGENSNLPEQEVYRAQAELLDVSLKRLDEALGGMRFDGTASDATGSIHHGTFIVLGPTALFQSDDGQCIGVAEQRLGSLEPTVIAFGNPEDTAAATELFEKSAGFLPLDPTIGNAHKIEKTKESFWQHVQKGGVVMYPIYALAGFALLVALYKTIAMMTTQTPSQKQIKGLLESVANRNEAEALKKASAIKGPVGRMLQVGVEHLREPRDLIEEVMYEKMLSARLKLERMLPFIAISAASAPLLGLLGTVTGIINTFKLITAFGSGDVKMLSGGISEALITTECGLIVAIPSLLIHAILSRKARSIVNQMEKAAVALINQVSKTPLVRHEPVSQSSGAASDAQVQDFLDEMQNRDVSIKPETFQTYSKDSAGGLMKPEIFKVNKSTTIGQVIQEMQSGRAGEEPDAVYIVDEQGKYVGHVLIQRLLTRPEQTRIDDLKDDTPWYVRVDAPKNEVQDLFRQHNLSKLPVLDHEDQLVGCIARNGN